MSNSASALWPTVLLVVAAFLSFLATLSIMLIHRRNLLESLRPELVLTGWSRFTEGQGDSAYEVIAFETLKNVGRGAAHRVHLNPSSKLGLSVASSSIRRVPVLAANEVSNINGRIDIRWKNIKPVYAGSRHLPITITIYCWDSRDKNRYETRYNLLAVELATAAGDADEIAPGVMFTNRVVITRPVWFLNLTARYRRIHADVYQVFRDFFGINHTKR